MEHIDPIDYAPDGLENPFESLVYTLQENNTTDPDTGWVTDEAAHEADNLLIYPHEYPDLLNELGIHALPKHLIDEIATALRDHITEQLTTAYTDYHTATTEQD